MEMNLDYFEATLSHLQSKGFTVRIELDDHCANGELVFSRKRARCDLDETCRLSLEALSYLNGREDFFLEIIKMGRMRSFSFPLDSWKFHADRIEFKFRDDPETGLGLALTVDLG